MTPLYRVATFAVAALLLAGAFCADAGAMVCDLSARPVEQAQCLLGTERSGTEGLPPVLQRLVGRPVKISERALRAALLKRRIAPRDIGGALADPVSRTERGLPARYFLIHDTSHPVFAAGRPFPRYIDYAGWNRAVLRKLVAFDQARGYGAHLYIDRAGHVLASFELGVPRLSTKAERAQPQLVGLFIAVECLQPRGLDAAGRDRRIPVPAFSAAQLDTLALAYIVASYRAKQWLIPAFHSAVDAGMPGAHDDPQGFELKRWTARVAAWAERVAVRSPRKP